MSQYQHLCGAFFAGLFTKGNGAKEREPPKAEFYIHSKLGAAGP